MFKKDNFKNTVIEVCETADALKHFKTNCLIDCSLVKAGENNLAPARIAVEDDVVQIICPSNGCYQLKLKVAASFQPGVNYCWSFACQSRSLVEAQKYVMQVGYKLGEGAGMAIAKNVVLADNGCRIYTFIISIPPGAAPEERILDLEMTNPDLNNPGGIIQISRMELRQEFYEHEVYDLWPTGLPPGRKEVLPNQEYIEETCAGTYRGRPYKWFRDVSRPSIIVHYPEVKANPQVGVILCPGGSFDLLDSMEQDAAWLNSLGITAIELKYRVPCSGSRNIALQDAQRALRLVRSKAAELKIVKLGMMGVSAGSHLALMAATNFERNSYAAMDSIDTFDCRPDFVISICTPYALRKDGTFNDEIRIDDKTPPVFFAHGDADPNSAVNSAALYCELRKRNIPSELHVWSKAGHGIGITSETGKQWSVLCEKWLKTLGIIKP